MASCRLKSKASPSTTLMLSISSARDASWQLVPGTSSIHPIHQSPSCFRIAVYTLPTAHFLTQNRRNKITEVTSTVPASIPLALLHADELYLEYERGAGGYSRHALVAVTQRRRDGQTALAANLHTHQTFVPAFDHLAHAKHKRKRLPAIRAIELPAGVF